MKKILTLLFVATTLISTAQESVKLRVNLKKGDVYLVKMNMNQNMPSMSMNMVMDAKTSITDVKDGTFVSETKFTKIDMGMLQNGMEMKASTDAKDEDLDATGKQLKSGLDPMLKVVVTTVTSELGKVIEAKIEPQLPGTEQMKNQTGSITFPEKALRVGDSWIEEKSENGVNTKTTYTVKSISKETVDLDMTGVITGIGEGKLNGSATIDIASGMPKKTKMNTTMNAQGQDIKVNITISMEKVK